MGNSAFYSKFHNSSKKKRRINGTNLSFQKQQTQKFFAIPKSVSAMATTENNEKETIHKIEQQIQKALNVVQRQMKDLQDSLEETQKMLDKNKIATTITQNMLDENEIATNITQNMLDKNQNALNCVQNHPFISEIAQDALDAQILSDNISYANHLNSNLAEVRPPGTKRGLLIVFEGLDKTGKTTQAQKLHEYFKTQGMLSVYKAFPGRRKKTKLSA
jgi:signal recognition particle GTPase